jgi:hypothetical protein
VPTEARAIAETHLRDVPSKVKEIVTDEMVVGDSLDLQ